MESDNLDDFNCETFGEAGIGDWEFEHEKFVLEYDTDKLPPSPREIPKIWETADLSEFWSAADLDVSQSYDSVLNFEESVDKLVREDELEDPAILNISKYAPRPYTYRQNPFAAVINPSDIWSSGPPQNNIPNSQKNNNNAESLNVLSEQLNINLNISDAPKMPPRQTLESHLKNSANINSMPFLECYRKGLPPPHSLLRMPSVPPEQLQQLLSSVGVVPSQRPFSPYSMASLPRPQSMSLMAPSDSHLLYSRLNTLSPPCITPSIPLPSACHLPKPFAMSPKAPYPPVRQLQHQLFQQVSHLSPLDASQLLDIFHARIEAKQPDKASFDPRLSCWMSPQDQLLVLNCHLRSLNVSSPYVEDYYFAVKFLRRMSKVREAKLANGALPSQVPPPYASIPAPIASSQLLNPDHPHRIALRCRFIISRVLRRCAQPSSSSTSAAVASTSAQTRQPSEGSLKDCPAVSPALSADPSPYSTQLGRPTKSNINAQRIIADLSVATALDEEQNGHFKTEAEEVASMLKATEKTSAKIPQESLSRFMHHRIVVHQRRHLAVLARIERLYATLLNIDETNVSLARIFVRNDESRHLMGHRLNLLKVLHRDLFLIKRAPPEQSASTVGHTYGNGDNSTSSTMTTRHLAVEIFEVPKGCRLFPLVLRFLFPEDRQFCVAEFISQFSRIITSTKANIDTYAHMLYAPCRDSIYKGANSSSTFVPSCLKLTLSNLPTTSPPDIDALIEGKLEPNAVAMFTSRLGVSLFFCLMDACARNSHRDDPTLFCELFVYACRIVDELEQQRQIDLPTPLERFTHFAQLDPLYLMSPCLAAAYQRKALTRHGATLRRLALLSPLASNAAMSPSQPTHSQPQSIKDLASMTTN